MIRIGSTFSFDVAIAQVEALASQQIRTIREYSVNFTGLTVGKLGSMLNQIIKGDPKNESNK